jgi:hypothetical protein
MSRGNVQSRLERLEASARSGPSGGRCPECGLSPEETGSIVLKYDGTPAEGFPDDPGERCERCGRPLWCVLNLVYDEEGEGAIADA